MSDKAWHISYLSAIVGPCAATTDDGCMAWEDAEKSDFVMRLLDRDNDRILRGKRSAVHD